MLRTTQLRIERELAKGLMALPQSTRAIVDKYYENALNDYESGRIAITPAKDDDLKVTMEAVNYAIKGFRQGS